ncbi:MAG: hypothetical protein JSV65_14360 [Armatimonadota bacterium]|nr:MAG: hypothetical protein JSV65_14360 [Armatimonadota bacterium]
MSLEHANYLHVAITGIISVVILYTILSARGGRELFIRRIPGLAAIDEAVGRATEMGRPMLFSTGLGGVDIDTIQGLAIAQYVAALAARYGNRLIVPAVDPVVFAIAEQLVREAYASEGKPEAFRSDDVRFLSDQQFAFAAGVMGIINREQVASTFFFGYFYAESLLLAETGQEVGAIQIAGTPATTQIPFFLAACDYTIIGDEFYAASAYLTREPTLLGSLVGQDISKGLLVLLVLCGTATAAPGTPLHFISKWLVSMLNPGA